MPSPKTIKTPSTRIAFIGIGLMGLPMATNLLQAGYPVLVWNRTAAKTLPLQELGAQVCDSVEHAISDADIVITMLETGPVVDQLLYQTKAFQQANAGTLFVDMSSIAPELARQHAEQLQQCQLHYLDAPVSGGTVGAEQASLSIMAGGSAADFERAKPIFEVLGTPHHVGPCGTGQLAKLANQAIVGITIGAVSEALLLAEAGGADPAAVKAALSGGFAASRILELHGQRMIDRDFKPGARARVQLKDMRTIVTEARQQGLQLPLSEQTLTEYQAMIDEGLEELDHSGLFQHLLNQHPKLA
ncbi:NAD(P)-dependent oxidoreductase [Motiliproteus coralliicola]|uniref:NAD(P)-dependent oxidoreductase n=1 Tax=Motiliproteus coralliicola TaxID=2283196 RepID=A0A369WSQ5_9GAMM|nr:NAD(P)-dependent oxidoreductase [Motiliproteus coralliicola]RDE24707.1 NAD(P)-dependent oxidoreductase [Motiliproteus coralliicola]